jgi:tetratricopeptide (TPR) repeat protein
MPRSASGGARLWRASRLVKPGPVVHNARRGLFVLSAAIPTLTVLLLTGWVVLGQVPPALQPLPLDSYPAAMREVVSSAYRDAQARPADAAATGSLARVLHAWEQWSAAHDAYSRAAALAPGAFEWRYLDACVLERLARPADAAARLEEALALRPDYLAARVKLAEALLEAGQIEESRPLFTALLDDPHARPEALFGLARIAAAEGKHEDAVTKYQRAIALFPEWGAAHYSLALSLRALGRREEAKRALEKHAQYGPRWPAVEDSVLASVNAVRTDAAARLRRGQKLADDGDINAAIEELEGALMADKSLSVAHELLITLYGRTRDWGKAEEHYRAALLLGPNAEIHYDYGVLLGLQEKWDGAADAYRQAIAINPSYAEAHNNLGQVLERTRLFDKALEEYQRAMETQPTFRLARFNAGRMLIALGRPAEAVAVLESLVEPPDAESARYVFALSVANIRSGNKADGIKWAAEARRRAAESGQQDLAAAIDRELASIK